MKDKDRPSEKMEMKEPKVHGHQSSLEPTDRVADGEPPTGMVLAVPQSTAIQRTPALCTATAKWKSKISKSNEVFTDGLMEDSNGHPLKTSSMKDGEPTSPSKQANGSAVRPSISITGAPQVGRPSSRVSGRMSASSLSMLAAESGKLLQAIPLATGGLSGQTTQDNEISTLKMNNHALLAAIPYMPVGLACLCLILNVFIPGSGTLIAGFSIFCCKGVPQANTKKDELISSFCTNVCVAIAQLFTITFLLVGWIWSVTWGVFMVEFALEYRNFKRSAKKISAAKAVTKAFMGR